MKNNFKIGDIVTLQIPKGKKLMVGDREKTGFIGGITPTMINFLNSRTTYNVVDVADLHIQLQNGHGFCYDYTWFKKIEKAKVTNVKFIQDDKETLAIIDNQTMGIAIKSQKDKRNDNIGLIISLLRALEIDKDIENKIINILLEKNLEKVDLSKISNKELLKEISKRMW